MVSKTERWDGKLQHEVTSEKRRFDNKLGEHQTDRESYEVCYPCAKTLI